MGKLIPNHRIWIALNVVLSSSKSSVKRSKKEKDEAARLRLSKLNIEIQRVSAEYSALEEIWKREKESLEGASRLKETLEQTRLDFDVARRNGDWQTMAELQHGKIPQLEKQLQEASEAENSGKKEFTLLRNKVTEDEIAEVVSRWTGVPVNKMLEGERESSCEWRRNCTVRSSVRMKPLQRLPMRCVAPVPVCPTPIGPMAPFCFLARPGLAKPSCASLWRPFCLIARIPWYGLICPNTWRNIRWPV